MSELPSIRHRIFLVYLLLTFYCFGAAMINEFAEYYSWANLGQYISPADFAKWLSASNKIRVPFLVFPMIIDTILAFALIKYLPVNAPRWALGIILICHIVAWISTFVFQLPLEMQLGNKGYSAAIMERLLATDWIRKAAFFIEIPFVIFIAFKVFFDKKTNPLENLI